MKVAFLKTKGTVTYPEKYKKYIVCNLRGWNEDDYRSRPAREVSEIWELYNLTNYLEALRNSRNE